MEYLSVLQREFTDIPVDYHWIKRFVDADPDNALVNARNALRYRMTNKGELLRVQKTRACRHSYDALRYLKCGFHGSIGDNLCFIVRIGQSDLRKSPYRRMN